jgi:hypothetical protein
MAYKKSNPYVYKPGPMGDPNYVHKNPPSDNSYLWWVLCLYLLAMGTVFAFSSKDTAAGLYAGAALTGTIGYTTRKRNW